MAAQDEQSTHSPKPRPGTPATHYVEQRPDFVFGGFSISRSESRVPALMGQTPPRRSLEESDADTHSAEWVRRARQEADLARAAIGLEGASGTSSSTARRLHFSAAGDAVGATGVAAELEPASPLRGAIRSSLADSPVATSAADACPAAAAAPAKPLVRQLSAVLEAKQDDLIAQLEEQEQRAAAATPSPAKRAPKLTHSQTDQVLRTYLAQPEAMDYYGRVLDNVLERVLGLCQTAGTLTIDSKVGCAKTAVYKARRAKLGS